MSGRQKKFVQNTKLFCLNCGAEGIPIWRDRSKMHGKGHRKVMYCPSCRQTVNHIELIAREQVEQFRKDFAAGKYRAEAEESIRYIKERKADHEDHL